MSKPALASLLVTLFIHGSLVGGVAAFSNWGDDEEDEDETRKIMTIEAALAYRSDKPSDLPQKERKRKKKKKQVKKKSKARKVVPGKPKSQDQPDQADEPPDEDYASQYEALRAARQNQEEDEDDSDDWEENDTDVEPAGTFDGSKQGFAEANRGDPYMQKLAADAYEGWELTTLEKKAGKAIGCVRLSADGSVMATELWKPTGENRNLELSVEHALEALKKKRKPNQTPVPAHLMDATTQWTCFRFSVDGL